MKFFNSWIGLLIGLLLLLGLVSMGSMFTLKPGEVAVVIEYSPQELIEKIGQLWQVFGHTQVTIVQSIGKLPGAETTRELTYFPVLKYEFIETFLSQGGKVKVIQYEDVPLSTPWGKLWWRPPWPLASISKIRLDQPHHYELVVPLYAIEEQWVDVLYLRGSYTISDLDTWVKEMYSSRKVEMKELDYYTTKGRLAYFSLLRGEKRFEAILNGMLIPHIESNLSTIQLEATVEDLARRLAMPKSKVLENLHRLSMEYPEEVERARQKARAYVDKLRLERPQELIKGFLEFVPQYTLRAGVNLNPQLSLNIVKEPLSKWRR